MWNSTELKEDMVEFNSIFQGWRREKAEPILKEVISHIKPNVQYVGGAWSISFLDDEAYELIPQKNRNAFEDVYWRWVTAIFNITNLEKKLREIPEDKEAPEKVLNLTYAALDELREEANIDYKTLFEWMLLGNMMFILD